MISCIDRKLSLSELRKEFARIYPTAKNLHMNIIASVMMNTNFNEVKYKFGIHYDFYKRKNISNTCKEILDKEETK